MHLIIYMFYFRLCVVDFRKCALPVSWQMFAARVYSLLPDFQTTWRGKDKVISRCVFSFPSTMSAGTPKSLPSSGQKSIQDICHPLSAEESVLTPSPDAANTSSSIGHKVSSSMHPSAQRIMSCLLNTADWNVFVCVWDSWTFILLLRDLSSLLFTFCFAFPLGFVYCVHPLTDPGTSL